MAILQVETSSSAPLMKETITNLLPHNFEAEQALLGILLHKNSAFEKIGDFLKSKHFADPTHGRIYEALSHFIGRGQLANPITLSHFFKNDEGLQEVGGAQYLAFLANSVISLVNTEDYGRQIYDLYLRRQLIDLGEEVTQGARVYTLGISVQSQIESAEKKLFELAHAGEFNQGFQPFQIAMTDAIKSAEIAFKRDTNVVGVSTGFLDLDKKLGGLHPSDLIIVAGRPSMGKTAFATNIAFNAAAAHMQEPEYGGGGHVAFFSLEMSAEQLALRLLGQETGVPSDFIRRGEISQDVFHKLVMASRKFNELPLYIDETPALTVSALRNRARRLKRQHGLDLVVIDYLQLLSSDGRSFQENRVQELSEITRGLKTLAKELNIPVIALSQLSRAVEQREHKRPMLSDLRESGSIEQDADVVIFLYREEYYESRKKPDETDETMRVWQRQMEAVHNLAEVIIAKQRHGPIGSVQLHFEGKLTKFSNLSLKRDRHVSR